MISHLRRHIIAAFAAAVTFAPFAHAESLLIGGTGSATPLIQRLFEEFQKQAPNNSLTQATPPLGSGGGIKALMTGRIDMAVVSRALKPDEEAALGRSFKLGDTPFVMAATNTDGQNGFLLDELADIYWGRRDTWAKNRPLRLILRTIDDSDTAMLVSMSPAMAVAVKQADERRGMAIAHDDLDALDKIENMPGALGPTTLGLIQVTQSRAQVLAIN